MRQNIHRNKYTWLLITVIVLLITVISIAVNTVSLINKTDRKIGLTENRQVEVSDGTATLIKPKYEANETIVADYVINPAANSSTDMYQTIQSTLNSCYNQGGGTVWLSAGVYYISHNITIPELCTLRGDWQDPDNYTGALEYGTIIVADVNRIQYDTTEKEKTGLFRIPGRSAGVVGITVYYKNQSITSPIEQPWTFYYGSERLKTIKNVTLINSYFGIGRSMTETDVHEMLMIENVKGTVINKGVVLHNSSDVGTIMGLTLKPSYWANANLSALGISGTNPTESAIISKVKSIGGAGLILTDIEQQQMANIKIDGYKYGVYVPIDDGTEVKRRAMGSGLFYNLNITNCNFGIMADEGYEVDWRLGYIITNSSIAGSDYAIYNNAKEWKGKRGTIKLNDVTLRGKIGGSAPIIYYSEERGEYISVSEKIGSGDATGIINNTGKFSNLNLDRKTKTYGNVIKTIEPGSDCETIQNALRYVGSMRRRSSIFKTGGI